MYVGSYAICVLNWNWWLTQDHFLIKLWSQRTHRCSARVVGLEEYSLGLVSRYSTVRSGTLTWREWGLWLAAWPARLPGCAYLLCCCACCRCACGGWWPGYALCWWWLVEPWCVADIEAAMLRFLPLLAFLRAWFQNACSIFKPPFSFSPHLCS